MYDSLIDTIGNTPLVEVGLSENSKVRILAKLEYLNPGGSIKDRAALSMIEHAEKSGQLTKDKTVIEATSGNTGIGLALVCSIKGYKLVLTMSESVSLERRKILEARGAAIILTPSHLSSDGAIEEAYRLTRENPDVYFNVDQYNNEANWMAHYHGTAEEILDQTKGQVSMVIATMGTCGTVMGLSRKFKEKAPSIEIVGVEPSVGHKIQGLKNMKESYPPGIYDKRRLDRIVTVEDEEAFETARLLAKQEGLFVGMSSGAAMAAAVNQAKSIKSGTIVVILPDGGERYLSTNLFSTSDKKGSFRLFNTLGREKMDFVPREKGKVGIYSCGPTVHARMHLGEARRFVFSDLLCRYLEYSGYQVNHVMNITDLDDKTIEGAEKSGLELEAFTKKNIDDFKNDLGLLCIKPANSFPLASDHVDEMISLTEKVVGKGMGYEKLRSVYFDISRLSSYGRLSGIRLDKIKVGSTVDLEDYEKENPRDFTLLKRSRLNELKKGNYWETQWGNIRPSWHIQCPAMAMKYLSSNFDIHTSARHLIFPHHENEIAIAEAATGQLLANYWMHCGPVTIDGKEVDEENRFFNIPYLMEQKLTPREIRFWLLSTNYRRPVIYSEERLEQVRKTLKRMDNFIETLTLLKAGQNFSELDHLINSIIKEFNAAMDDDLNIAAALSIILKKIKEINILIDNQYIDSQGSEKLINVFKQINSVLGIFSFEAHSLDRDTQSLIEQRDAAREEKNWVLADEIRSKLELKGVDVRDQKSQ
ncbi:cysteine--tRNA ligase [Desulfospira joergensenii]|uniref:cysteine--tRNA ligase n=1 Tax=Desulfospira joergensenii TaxID=53329 RepID=UPI0003B51033|nr:cysteine--tRNA ligase [Desulfospira joergensenii]